MTCRGSEIDQTGRVGQSTSEKRSSNPRTHRSDSRQPREARDTARGVCPCRAPPSNSYAFRGSIGIRIPFRGPCRWLGGSAAEAPIPSSNHACWAHVLPDALKHTSSAQGFGEAAWATSVCRALKMNGGYGVVLCGSSMRLMVPEMFAASLRTMNSKPSFETSVTNSDGPFDIIIIITIIFGPNNVWEGSR
jgi:hypothetical protein